MTGANSARGSARLVIPKKIQDRNLKTIAWLLTWPSFAYGCLFTLTRPLGQIPYILVLTCSIVACLLARRLVFFRAQRAFIILSTCYLGLSLASTFMDSWTVYHDNGAAVRQWSWVIAMPFFTSSFVILIEPYFDLIWRHILKIAFFIYIVTRISLSMNPDGFKPELVIGLYSLDNESVVVIALLISSAFRKRVPGHIQVPFLAGVAAASTSLGSLLSSAMGMIIRLVPAYRTLVTGLLVVLIAFLAVAPAYRTTLYDADHNSGVRALFWHDAQAAVRDTYGAGVGYGTEYIRNDFHELGAKSWTLTSERADNRLYVSTHSTFYDIALRTGILGLVLFLWQLFSMALSLRSRAAAAGLAIFFIGCAVTPAMTAVDTQVGLSALLAWIYLCNAKGRRNGRSAH